MATPNVKLVSVNAATLDSDAGAQTTEIDLGPYVNSGHRQITAIWAPTWIGAASDTDFTFDLKFQESATTASTDYGDITGAAFTQVTAVTGYAWQTITFNTMKRYVRAYWTLAGTAVSVMDYTALLLEPRFTT